MKEMGWWILDENHTPQYIGSGAEPAIRYAEKVWQRVDETWVGPYHISTVFMGLDMGHSLDGLPLLFETMVFCRGSASDLISHRYATWAAAVAGHAITVDVVRSWGWTQRMKDEWAGIWRHLGLFYRRLRTRIGNRRESGPDIPRPTPPRQH